MLSAYEFTVEVAARVLNRPKDYKPDPTKVNTRDVWPWSQLVPFMEEDMVMRVRRNCAPSSTVLCTRVVWASLRLKGSNLLHHGSEAQVDLLLTTSPRLVSTMHVTSHLHHTDGD